MIEERIMIGLVVERRRLESAWAEAHGTTYAWRPAAVFAVPPDVAAWTPLGSSPLGTRYYAGAYDIHLYSTETSNYRDNLEAERPRLWVVLRPEGAEPPVEVAAVTADPAEGEGQTEAGTNTVETIDMPVEVAAEIARFIEAHHVERPILKRKRDRAGYDERWRPGEGPQPDGKGRRNRSGGDA
ncbi:MAG: molybdopterin-guanine dinucleotide biosynthesis protein A [Hyphomicrobium sp.]|nr:MAG: molybdopterin-guanine dinucleotide biosynthesis protein A [Hyphomicrobium sp.]